MEYCGNCKQKLDLTNKGAFGYGRYSDNYRLCVTCNGKLLKINGYLSTKKLTVEEIEEKFEIEKHRLNKKLTENQTIELNFDSTLIENLLAKIGTINNLSEIESWDSQANIFKKNIINYVEKLKYAKKQIENEIENSKGLNPFKNYFAKTKIKKNNKSFLNQYDSVLKNLSMYENQLHYWISVSPNSIQELNEMKSELKNKKQLFAIRKKELNVYKKQAWSTYRQDSAYVEFSSPKLRNIFRGRNIQNREENLKPYDIELNNIILQTVEIEKLLLWLNRLK